MRTLILSLLIGLIAFPAFAQDVTTAPAVQESTLVAIVVLFAGIITVALIVFAYLQNKSVSAIYDSIPASGQTLIGLGLEFLLRQASTSASSLDDEALHTLAETLGYTVTRMDDGRVILTPPASK